jgi:predicted DNA repair protein MutK
MASGFFAILDDIAALMDDVALATKLATRKTAGILGDDLAVNAEKATGFLAERELPILWAITKGSLINKLIIVPIALLLNAFFPVAITYILILGGCYLAYEGAEKIIEHFFKVKKETQPALSDNLQESSIVDHEKAKIKSAIMTDFILSVEIVIIALGAVAEQASTIQALTVSAVALLATVGVYGIVALIVRTDDVGHKLIKRSGNKGFLSKLGHVLIAALPVIIRILSVVGTLALLLVAGGIFVHNIHYLHTLFPQLPAQLKEFVIGLAVGLVIAGIVTLVKSLTNSSKKSVSHH